ncbi:hepatic lectin-like [Mercenaria mercenaria]|uniref:hepatic lectin-like n=1 Tax=Mercenaria mercenaria TaxID=6596 RepID=UPI00234F4AC1|nr:hepatic lectin-like [Mercenaria mercenaria]
MHGQLVEVECEAEWVFLKSQAEQKSLGDFWIALTNAFEQNDWSWINTWRTASFTAWEPGEPNNNGALDEECVHARKDRQYKWNDRRCKQMQGQLVEVECEGEWVFLKTQAEMKTEIWFPGQPDNNDLIEHCVHAAGIWQYHWNDKNCDQPYPYTCICEA